MMRSLALMLLFILAIVAPASPADGGTSPAPVGAPGGAPALVPVRSFHSSFCRKVANFAVLVHSLVYNDPLALVDVVSPSVEPAGIGYNFFLVLNAADKKIGKVTMYQALVWGVPDSTTAHTWLLLSFKQAAK